MGVAAFAVSVGFLPDAQVGHSEFGLPAHAGVVRCQVTPCTVRTDNAWKFRFSASVGEKPESEVGSG